MGLSGLIELFVESCPDTPLTFQIAGDGFLIADLQLSRQNPTDRLLFNSIKTRQMTQVVELVWAVDQLKKLPW